MIKNYGNFVGAFADGAILFPLLVALSLKNGFSGVILLGTAGAAYITSGLIFRVPMSVQPLKAIAIAALALGATQTEIRISAALLGIICLIVSLFPVNDYISKIPRSLIHGLQLSLGIILLSKGLGLGVEAGLLSYSIILTVIIIYLSLKFSFPLLGIFATCGLIYAIFFGFSTTPLPSLITEPRNSSLQFSIIFALLIPQVILTLSNSVVGTYDVAKKYFKEKANRVTPKRLLHSIGFGNLISASIGGLPFCHGSGGVTAHFKGGSTHFISNLIIGFTLIGFALFQFLTGSFSLNYPPLLLAALLAATGFFHLQLASPSWVSKKARPRLILMALAALLTSNMLWVLITGLVWDLIALIIKKERIAHDSL